MDFVMTESFNTTAAIVRMHDGDNLLVQPGVVLRTTGNIAIDGYNGTDDYWTDNYASPNSINIQGELHTPGIGINAQPAKVIVGRTGWLNSSVAVYFSEGEFSGGVNPALSIENAGRITGNVSAYIDRQSTSHIMNSGLIEGSISGTLRHGSSTHIHNSGKIVGDIQIANTLVNTGTIVGTVTVNATLDNRQGTIIGEALGFKFGTRFLGSTKSDVFIGGVSADWVEGNGGDDKLKGDRGEDKIWGGSGRDHIFGGPQADRLYAGVDTDRDVFVYGPFPFGASKETGDLIYEFDNKNSASDIVFDIIDLRPIDADNEMPGNQAFRFPKTFTTVTPNIVEGQVRFASIGKDVIVQIDVNGDKLVDLNIRVVGVGTLSRSNLAL